MFLILPCAAQSFLQSGGGAEPVTGGGKSAVRPPNHELQPFLPWKHIGASGSRSTPRPGSAAPPQRPDSKREGAKGQGQPARAPARPTSLGPRTRHLCNTALLPLLVPALSQHAHLSPTKSCVSWRRNTKSSQQCQNHTTTKLRDTDFFLKCL